jgi:NAD(P)-dependent dehydrogenase (short-subunit alcohol dehydrogenase family)
LSNNPHLFKFSLLSRWVVVTGAAGLLGKQHSIALLEIGANVILLDKDSDKLKKLHKELTDLKFIGAILSYQIDITDEVKIEELRNELLSKGILVNVLINNAAINPKYEIISDGINSSRVENFDLADWDLQLNVGLKGAFICSKAFGSNMAKNKNGVILNIASDLSVIAPDQRIYKTERLKDLQNVKPVTYSVIKSGLIGMTKYLATYWNESNVRVNALSPGGVYENQDSNFIDKLNNLIPLGRMAAPDEYKSAIQFLCSDASSYMTGHNLIIDGGRSIW